MKNHKIIKTFEDYESPEYKPDGKNITEKELNEKIKEVINNILKTKQYFMLLQDTIDQVVNMFENQIPPNIDAFLNTLVNKNVFLAELVGDLIDSVDNSSIKLEMDEIIRNLKNLDAYTEDNMDNILSGDFEEEEDEEDEDEDEDEDGIDDEDEEENKSEKIGENLKSKFSSKGDEIKDFIRKYKKTSKTDKFKVGDIIYLNEIRTGYAKNLNGRKCKIINRSKKENCWDLYDYKSPGKSGEANIFGMPEQYMFKEKPDITTEVSKIRVKPKAVKKSSKNE